MIEVPTTLILGAGAHASFGFPLGDGLRDNILAVMKKQDGAIRPLMQTVGSGQWQEFQIKLSRGGWLSPDAFLEAHPEYLNLGKHLIAHCLCSLEKPEKIFPAKNWHRNLIAAIQTRTVDEFRKNKLSIVTYNYDRTMEHQLHEFVTHRFGLPPNDAWQVVNETVPIVHVHGMLGKYPDAPYSPTDDLSQAVAGIKIIHEFQDVEGKFCSDEFERANALLRSSKVIYSLGFGMATQNLKRLRFFEAANLEDREFKAAIGNVGPLEKAEVDARVANFGILTSQIFANDCNLFFRYSASLGLN